jgi:acetyl esterase/lipase
MKLSKLFIAIIAGTTFFSCKKNDDSNNNPAAGQTILNIAYGTDPLQKMDIYLPPNANAATTKVIIALHGGGWREGDKVDLQNFVGINFIDTLKKRLPDYAIFNINYRLSNGITNLFPTQENDVKAAVQFIFNKSADYAISNKYVLIGASAGAHLAMLQGYKYSAPVKPKAIISFFGPGDLTEMYNNPAGGITGISTILALTIGKTPVQDAALYSSSSPVTFINNTSVPTILFHGGADPLVNASQSELIKNKLTAAGIANQYTLYPGKGHGDDWGNALYADAFNKIQVFLAAHVQ